MMLDIFIYPGLFALGFIANRLFFSHGETPLTGLKELQMAVEQAFADVATQIEGLGAKFKASQDAATADLQSQLDAANAEIATLKQNAADNLAAVQTAVTDVTPPAPAPAPGP
jgi:hypothetical protein